MVSDGGPRDRGQLILIGAVAIAFILLGIVVVFNSVLYTQSIASSDTIGSGVDAQTTELELERGSSKVTQSANRNASSDDYGDPEEFLFEDQAVLWEFIDGYQLTKAGSKPTIVEVNRSTAEVTEHGRLVHQTTEDNFTDTPTNHKRLFNGTIPTRPTRDIGDFEMTIDRSSLDNPLQIWLRNESNQWNNMTISRSDSNNVTVVLNRGAGGNANCELEALDDGNVTINFVEGTAIAKREGDGCDSALELTSQLDGEYSSLWLENNGGARGTYDLVVSKDSSDGVADPNERIAWTLEFVYYYDTAEVSYSRTIQVDVYGGDS